MGSDIVCAKTLKTGQERLQARDADHRDHAAAPSLWVKGGLGLRV